MFECLKLNIPKCRINHKIRNKYLFLEEEKTINWEIVQKNFDKIFGRSLQ